MVPQSGWKLLELRKANRGRITGGETRRLELSLNQMEELAAAVGRLLNTALEGSAGISGKVLKMGLEGVIMLVPCGGDPGAACDNSLPPAPFLRAQAVVGKMGLGDTKRGFRELGEDSLLPA